MDGMTPNTTEVPNDIEVIDLGKEAAEIASARAAVEAMKKSGMFAEKKEQPAQPAPEPVVAPVSMSGAGSMPATAPIFSPEQLDEVEQPANAAQAVAMAKAQGDTKKVFTPQPISADAMENLASSAAEAVAMMNKKEELSKVLGSTTKLSADIYTDTAADDFSIEEQYPEWKAELDKINRDTGIKISDIESGLREQFDDILTAAHGMIQTALGVMEKQIAATEQSMRDAIKKAGSSTEEAVKNERARLQEISNAEKEAIMSEYDKQIAEIKAAHNQEIIKMKDSQLDALDKMKQMYSEQMDEIKAAYEEKIKLLQG